MKTFDDLRSLPKCEKFKSLRLKNLCFFYPQSKTNVIEDISFELKAGESIGFIGASGSGKTTFLDTVLGLFVPQGGSIEFNGRILTKHLSEWRAQVAYIPQQVFLIDDSLRCNIALGVNENEIDNIKLDESIHRARLTNVVQTLPDGVETIVGERGMRFSGGQCQRIALARAFYHNRNVLIMDEATSALDNETEQEIVNEIELLKGRVTIIVIAHNLKTLKHCDRIYELQNGKIIGMGGYNEILDLKASQM
jgi:ABC-type multidrug transport system fused ATPase/permease subunit